MNELHFLAVPEMIVPVDLMPHAFNCAARVLFFHKLFGRELPHEVRADVTRQMPGWAAPVLNPPNRPSISPLRDEG